MYASCIQTHHLDWNAALSGKDGSIFSLLSVHTQAPYTLPPSSLLVVIVRLGLAAAGAGQGSMAAAGWLGAGQGSMAAAGWLGAGQGFERESEDLCTKVGVLHSFGRSHSSTRAPHLDG